MSGAVAAAIVAAILTVCWFAYGWEWLGDRLRWPASARREDNEQ